MSKEKKQKQQKEKDTRNMNNRKEFKIPEDAKKLAKMNVKKFKKEEGDYYDSKKELKKAYYAHLVDYLPSSISLCIKYGHLESVKETRDQIYTKIADPDFVKYLTKEMKKNELEFDNQLLLPCIIYDIIVEAQRTEAAAKAEDPDSTVTFDVSALTELSKLILKKKIKKCVKDGMDENLAFDVLSVVPTPKILDKSAYFHVRSLFNVLYQHAKEKEIKFDVIMKNLLKKEEDEYINTIIIFALLERKEKVATFNASQQRLFNDITEYCFKTMEKLPKADIRLILKGYVENRKRDEANKKDSNRRYYIASLPESDYPKILQIVNEMVREDEKVKSYF